MSSRANPPPPPRKLLPSPSAHKKLYLKEAPNSVVENGNYTN